MMDPQNLAAKGLVDELLAKQDDVIGQLESLEAEILAAVETLAAERKQEQEADEQPSETPDVLPMLPVEQTTTNGKPTDGHSDSKAA